MVEEHQNPFELRGVGEMWDHHQYGPRTSLAHLQFWILEQDKQAAPAIPLEEERSPIQYIPVQPSRQEVRQLGRLRTPGELEAIKNEINRHAHNPANILATAMQENRVLAIGESHAEESPHRVLGSALMARLRQEGATHLAVELPISVQPSIDEFMRTGSLDRSVIPFFVNHTEYIALLRAAIKADLKIVCVDVRDGQDRDQHMAEKICDILKVKPNHKVVFWVGSNHLKRNVHPPSAASRISRRFSVVTVADKSDLEEFDPLVALSRQLRHPVALNMVETPLIRKLPVSFERPETDNSIYNSEWDILLVYPPSSGREKAASPPIFGPLLTAELGGTTLGFLSGARFNVVQGATRSFNFRTAFRGAATASAATMITYMGNYLLDRLLTDFDSGNNWWSVPPSRRVPFCSTIFRPTTIDSIAVGTAISLPLPVRYRLGLAGTAWLVGRAHNFFTSGQ